MRIRFVIAAAIAASSLAGPTLAAEPPAAEPVRTQAQAASTAPDGEKPKLICRRREDDADLGTRIRSGSKRVCMTKEEWDEERQRSQDAVRNLRMGVEKTAIGAERGGG